MIKIWFLIIKIKILIFYQQNTIFFYKIIHIFIVESNINTKRSKTIGQK